MLRNLFKWRRHDAEAVAVKESFSAVGYPKVGNTWIRLMLGKYLQLSYDLPELPVMDVAEFESLAAAGCKTIGTFTHGPIDWTSQTAADLTADNVIAPFLGRRVLFLTRHPLDTLVSLYMHERFQRGCHYDGSLVDMINDSIFGIDKLIRFHQLWAENYKRITSIMVVRYEDTRADPCKIFKDIVYFLGEPVNADFIRRAVEFASFENLKALEASGNVPKYKSSQLNIFGTGDKENPNAFHVRKGKVGGWRDELEPDIAHALEQRVRDEFPSQFGYV